MRRVYELVDRVAPSPARGACCAARAAPARSWSRARSTITGRAATRPFVAVNCTALPEPLLESELFGHARGAFTGATAARPGLIVEADGGTLFLDEIGDMPPLLQARLLRVLQEREVRAVGGDAARHVDVRVIAATHQRSRGAVDERRVPRGPVLSARRRAASCMPPLRERLDDVPLLADALLERARCAQPARAVATLAERRVAALAPLSRGRATCASSRTSSNVSWSWARMPRCRWPILAELAPRVSERR